MSLYVAKIIVKKIKRDENFFFLIFNKIYFIVFFILTRKYKSDIKS